MSKLFFFALGLHYLCPRKVIITMNKKFLISLLLGALCTFSAFAQQVTELQRTKSIFVYPDFCPGRVIQAFGRSVTDSVNIYYGDASLCFHRGDTIFKANLDGIYGLVIGDDEYKKVGTQMGRVVAKKGYNALICVTEVDHRKLEAETTGGEKLPYFQIDDGPCIDLEREVWTQDEGWPLQDKYYFQIKGGEIIPANQSKFKKFVRRDMKQAFNRLMNDKFWSWKDPQNLSTLLIYLPE